MYYEYSLKSDEEAVGILFKGRITSSNDTVNIQAYDWTNSVWVTVHTLIGTNLTTDTNVSSALVSKYTGTGSDAGKVRIRFVNAVTLTTAMLKGDYLILSKKVGENNQIPPGQIKSCNLPLDKELENRRFIIYKIEK